MDAVLKIVIGASAILVFAATQAAADNDSTCIDPTVDVDSRIAACTGAISQNTSREQVGEAYIGLCQDYYEKKEYDRAIQDCNAAITIGPKHVAVAYCDRGNVYYMKGEDRLAIESYTLAIEHNSNYPAAYVGRGLLYEKAGLIEKARADYQTALNVQYSGLQDNDWAHQTARAHLADLKDK
jgi:tetratricopeptide (TPR) repeat protein